MADQNTSTTNNDNLLMVYFSRKAIKTLHEKVHFYQIAEKFPLPSRSGTQMTFSGWRKLAAASTTLAEASSNSSVTLSSRKVNVTVQSYGRSVKITDLAELTAIIGPLEGAVRELTHSASLTLDNVIQLAVYKNVLAQVGQNADVKAKLLSGWTGVLASAFCANTGTSGNSRQFGFPVVFGTSATRLSAGTSRSISSMPGPILVRKCVTRLKRLAVDPMANGRYVGITHPNWISGLFANADYKQYVVNYAEGPRESFFKSTPTTPIHGVDIVESPNSPRYASSALSCTPIFIGGQGALGVVELGSGFGADAGMGIIIKRPGPQTVSEPYDLNGTCSYKLRAVAAVLNPSCGVLGLASNEKL